MSTDINSLFPHAHIEPHKGRWRVILTLQDGRQEVLRSGLNKAQAARIAETMRTVQ